MIWLEDLVAAASVSSDGWVTVSSALARRVALATSNAHRLERFLECFAVKDRGAIRDVIDGARSGRAAPVQIVHLSADLHENHPFAIAAQRLPQGSNDEIGLIFTDATSSTRPSLADELDLYRHACSAAQVGVYHQDTQWRFTYLSDNLKRTWASAFAMDPEAFLGRDPRDIFLSNESGPSRDELSRRHENALSGPVIVEFQASVAGSAPIWFEAREEALLDGRGAFVGIRGVCIDISRRKLAEDASQAKSQFLTSVSHELRTPLNGIIGFAEILEGDLREGGNASGASDAGRILRAASHLLGLINEVLDFSKIETGKMALSAEAVDLAILMNDVAASAESLAHRGGNMLVVENTSRVREFVTDPTKLKQCLMNLLSNAAKFTESGAISLTVSDLKAPPALVFVVRDSGVGIAEADAKRLFQPFVQADASLTRRAGGTGLGLAITRALAELMGGSVSLSSELGTGSAFTLHLPLASSPPTANPDEQRVA